MKTLRISDEAHGKLTGILGTLMAQTGRMKTFSDAIEALLDKSVMLPSEVVEQVQAFMEENKGLGYATKEEFIQDAIRSKITSLSEHKLSNGKSERRRPE